MRLVGLEMKLREDWRHVLKRAWSIRLALAGSALASVELGMSVLTGNPPIDPVKFAALYAAVSFLGAMARLVQQAGITPPAAEESAS